MIRQIPYCDPVAAFAPFAGKDGAVLLDSSAFAGGRGRWSFLCANPSQVFVDPMHPFDTLEHTFAALPRQNASGDEGLPPFRGGLVGWLGYEAGRHLERLPPARADDLGVPECAFGRYDAIVAFDHVEKRAWLCALPGGEDQVDTLLNSLGKEVEDLREGPGVLVVSDMTDAEAAEKIRAVQDAIIAGDIFQANFTRRWWTETLPASLTPWLLYWRLRAETLAPFAACLSFGGAHVLSASPERFLSVTATGKVETRPIKGTRPRGRSPEDDDRLAHELAESIKDRAENLMIVDLLRNDLARVCLPGTVVVPHLCALERFASVLHLVSVVEGQLRLNRGPVDLLRASFPGGSITGAPKIRAMEILNALEPCRRGPYCGSAFWLGADGAMDSSILIRSLVWGRSGRIAAQAGGGIVFDSDPWDEVEEAKLKVAPLLRALAGS